MVESDPIEGEPKDTQESQEKVSSDTISKKRTREGTLEIDEGSLTKKARIEEQSDSEKKSSLLETDKHTSDSHVNANVMDVADKDQSKDIGNTSNSNKINDETVDECSKTDDSDAPIKTSNANENESEEINSAKDTQENENNPMNIPEEESDKHVSSTEKQEETKDQSTENPESKKEIKNQKNKKKNEDSEIINGMELTVECASDEDPSEESGKEENAKPRPRTEIVREEPNDSEVDASSSEAEKSDSYEIIEAKSKSSNETTLEKNIEKSTARKSSSSKVAGSESENNSGSSTEDQDYSPVAKKKVQKSLSPKKVVPKPTESKRGRGRPRGRPPKNAIKLAKEPLKDEPRKKEATSTHETEKNSDKKLKEIKETDKAESKNEDSVGEESNKKSSSDSDESEDVKKGKRRKPSKRNIKKVENLKKFIRATGIKVNVNTLLKDCDTDAAKARRLTEFLHEHGVVGRPTLEKCNKIKIKNETLQEIQDLDTSNIISETRLTRGKNARKSQNETKTETKVPSSPNQKASEIHRRIKAVVDSDSE